MTQQNDREIGGNSLSRHCSLRPPPGGETCEQPGRGLTLRGKAASRSWGRRKVCRQLLRAAANSRLPAVMLRRGARSRKFFSGTLTRHEAGGDSLLLLLLLLPPFTVGSRRESVGTDSSRPQGDGTTSGPESRAIGRRGSEGLVRDVRSIIIRHVWLRLLLDPKSGTRLREACKKSCLTK